MVITWDETKNDLNKAKHGLSFEDASEVFSDPLLVSQPDRVVNGEERWLTYGTTRRSLLMVVVNTVTDAKEDSLIEVIHIISARYADKKARRIYETQNS